MSRRRRTSSPSSPRKRLQPDNASFQHLSAIGSPGTGLSPKEHRFSDGQRISADVAPVPPSTSSQPSEVASQIYRSQSIPTNQSIPPPWRAPTTHSSQESSSKHLTALDQAFAEASHSFLNTPLSTARLIQGPQPTEPTVKPGETLSLARHPNLIAAIIAQKRAENERNRNRERWVSAQQTYFQEKASSNGDRSQGIPMSTSLMSSIASKDAESIQKEKSSQRDTQDNAKAVPYTPITTPSSDSGRSILHQQSGVEVNTSRNLSQPQVSQPVRSISTALPAYTAQVSEKPTRLADPKTQPSPESVIIPPLFSDTPKLSQNQTLQQSLPSRSNQTTEAKPSLTHPIPNGFPLPPNQVSSPTTTAIPPINAHPQAGPNPPAPGYFKIDPRFWVVPEVSHSVTVSVTYPVTNRDAVRSAMSNSPRPAHQPGPSAQAPTFPTTTGLPIYYPPGFPVSTVSGLTQSPQFSSNGLTSNTVPTSSSQSPSTLPNRPPSQASSVKSSTISQKRSASKVPPASDIGGINTTFRHATRDAFSIPKR